MQFSIFIPLYKVKILFLAFFMRIDKYLWCIRLFKTRNMATEACKKGHVKINDSNVKPAKEIFGNEIINIRKNQMNYEIVVIDIPKSRVGAKLVDLYRKDMTPKEELERLDLLKFTKNHHRKKGTGRPTKRDRRDIDEYYESSEFSET